MEVDALTETLCFVSEQLSRVLGGDTGTRMEGLRRVSQSFDRDPISGFSGYKACLQDHGVQELRVLILPFPQNGSSPNQDRGPCLVQTEEGLSRCPARD